GQLVTFWRDGQHVQSRIWGQPAAEVFPISSREYFPKTAQTTWAFDAAKGAITGVTFNGNGRQQSLARLEEREGRAAVERSIDIEKRIQDQTPTPGGEQALLETIQAIAGGKPNYERMMPVFADHVRRELFGLQKILALGPVQSATFTRVLPTGADVY